MQRCQISLVATFGNIATWKCVFLQRIKNHLKNCFMPHSHLVPVKLQGLLGILDTQHALLPGWLCSNSCAKSLRCNACNNSTHLSQQRLQTCTLEALAPYIKQQNRCLRRPHLLVKAPLCPRTWIRIVFAVLAAFVAVLPRSPVLGTAARMSHPPLPLASFASLVPGHNSGGDLLRNTRLAEAKMVIGKVSSQDSSFLQIKWTPSNSKTA